MKQVDRLLSNSGIDVWQLFGAWVPYVLGQRAEAVVSLDWTDFDADDDTTLVSTLKTRHGGSTPVQKSALKGLRNGVEDALLVRLRECIPAQVKVTILADRGFADQKLYALLGQLGFDFVVRFRQCITVTSAQGERCMAAQWVPDMKEAWCLATSLEQASAAKVIGLSGRRFTIEEKFRDIKALRFGMGLSSMSIAEPERGDRLLLLGALAGALLTMLGEAGERLGLERYLKANTSKHRTYSLFRQGCLYYQAVPNMPEAQLRPLVELFGQLVREQPVFREVFGVI